MANFHFKKIELDCEREPDPQLCDSVLVFESMLTPVFSPDLDPIHQSTLILIPIDLENEPAILNSHILLMNHERELKFFDLKSTLELTLEPKLTFKLKLDLSHILESILVPEHFSLELKSTIPPSHILLLDLGIEQNDIPRLII